jgi:hypothetical protein
VLCDLIDSDEIRAIWRGDRQYVPLRRGNDKIGAKERPGLPLEEWLGQRLEEPLRPRMPSAGSEGVSIYFALPIGEQKNGEYPSSLRELTKKLRPVLVHIPDSTYMSFVVKRFDELGGGPIVSIYDAWYVAADAELTLRKAIEDAGEPWLRHLGPIYDLFIYYLKGTEHEKWATDLREQWDERVRAGRWPRFKVGAAETADLIWDDDGAPRHFGPIAATVNSAVSRGRK